MFQRSLFEQSTRVKIALKDDYELVTLSGLLNWTELTNIAMTIRDSKKAVSGPQPRYRALLGAVALMATKKMTYREAEDLIAHYAPARYLCDLMDSDVYLDHVTIFDFRKMLGEAGIAQINESVLSKAKELGFLDPTVLMSDTTAQEAMIPYPTEVGLMSRFGQMVQKAVGSIGGKFRAVKAGVKDQVQKIKELVRNSHLFAKGKEQKAKVGRKIHHTVKPLHCELAGLLAAGSKLTSKNGKELTMQDSLCRQHEVVGFGDSARGPCEDFQFYRTGRTLTPTTDRSDHMCSVTCKLRHHIGSCRGTGVH